MIQPKNARRIRPDMPHYGVMPDQKDGMLTWDWVDRQMTQSRNYWIATTQPDGRPHVVPIWGAWVEGSFYFGTDKLSVKARNIRRDNRVVIHLESGDDTVILEGRLVKAQVSAELQKQIDDAFVQKYELDPELDEDGALVYCLLPRKVMAWLESDYPATVTYWLFDV